MALFSFPLAGPLGGADPVDGRLRESGDIALAWSSVTGEADLAKVFSGTDPAAVDLATDRGLTTSVLLSLFLDRRAEPDDEPPSGDPNDRRGWWADQLLRVKGDRYGSRLWLLARAKRTNETALRAKEYVTEALAWMIEDRVVASVDVATEITTRPMQVGDEVFPAGSLLISIGLQRPGRDPVAFKFAHTWNAMQEAA